MISRTKKVLLSAAAGALAITGLSTQPASADPTPPPGYCEPSCAQDAYDLPNKGMPPISVPPQGRKLSYNEVARLFHSVGMPDNKLATAVAVIAQESSHNTSAYNGKGADESYGLGQTNFEGYLGPLRLKKYHLTSPKDCFVPETSARIVMDMSDGGKDWSAWGAYNSGAYGKWYFRAELATFNVLFPDRPQFPDVTQEEG